MKGKKLALGLAHLIGPHRADDRMPIANPLQSPPPSPYPGRRAPLSSKVESDLRAACAGVLVNTKPSHHYVPPEAQSNTLSEPKPALDYEAIKRSASARKSQDSRPIPPRTDSTDDKHPVKYAYRPDAAVDQLFTKADPGNDPVQAVLGKSKYDTPMDSRTKTPVPINVVSPSGDATARPRVSKRSLSGETNGSTPHTDLTEYTWSTSTAPTSAAITPARASKRASSYMPFEQDVPIKADANAIEWMRNELERRRQKQAAHEEQTAALPPLSRPPSRARSIRSLRDNIKEYIRPSSAGGPSRDPSRPPSRSQSRASLRSDSQSRDPDVRGGWRSWGRTLKKENAQTDVSRSSSRRGRSDGLKRSGSKKSQIDLNRELPPLPSLDQWKEAQIPVPTRPAPQAPAQTYRPAKPEHTRGQKSVDSATSEKDEIVAARLGSPVMEKPEVYMPTRSPRFAAATKMPNLGAAYTNDNVVSSGLPRSKSAGRAHTRDSLTTIPTTSSHHAGGSTSTSHSRLRSPSNPAFSNTIPGFSQHRNYDSSNIPTPLGGSISSNSTGQKTDKSTSNSKHDHKYRHVLKTRSPPPVPPKEAGDKKAWWNFKAKSKKQSPGWMEQLEKMGIKDGVLVPDEACGAPHIRY